MSLKGLLLYCFMGVVGTTLNGHLASATAPICSSATSLNVPSICENGVSDNEGTPSLFLKEKEDKEEWTSEPLTCSIYLAPSSLKGHAGFGMYTTRDIAKQEYFLRGNPADLPSIPVLDYHYGPHEFPTEEAAWRRSLFHQVFDNYWWGSGVPDHVTLEARHVGDFQLTFGALPNHHCFLSSIEERYPEVPYDDSMAPWGSSPGSGAFSYNMGRAFISSRELPAGSEIFLNYGHCTKWDVHQEWAENIPMPSDYYNAARVVLDYIDKNKPLFSNDLEPLEVDDDMEDPDMVASLLPQSLDELILVLEGIELNRDESDIIDDIALRLAQFIGSTPRTVEWIKENGLCLETLVGKESLISHAGLGAFAQHPVNAGEIIVPVPLLQIVDADALTMYDDNGDVWGRQLLLNYCFGNPESSLLLCPTSNAALINHCSVRTRDCPPGGPNAEMRWASGWDTATPEWLEKDIEEMSQTTGRGLSMEVVALRDIKVGEEVYIDYGVEWEMAWERYVGQWKEDSSKGWLSAKEANSNPQIDEEFVANDIRGKHALEHDYLFTGCRYHVTTDDLHERYKGPPIDWNALNDTEILKWFASNAQQYRFIQRGDTYESHPDRSHWPCTVLFQESGGSDGNQTYTVQIHEPLWEYDRDALLWSESGFPRILTNYPRSHIHFFVHPYSSDQLQPSAFRYPLGLPDEMWQEHWKNRKILPTYADTN